MESVNNNYLDKHKKFRIDSKKLAAVFAISAFLVAIIVFWWLKLVGITVTGEAFCGLDEHTHSEDCYISELVCGFDETVTGTLPTQEEPSQTEAPTEETSEAQSEGDEAEESAESSEKENDKSEETQPSTQTETTAEAHTHSDDCYSKTLSCKTPEHTHTQDCFPDKTADTETVSDWLSTIENIEITNNIPENLIAIATSQTGYEESEKNFEFDSEGNKNGYTRYGEWYGNPYGKWNTMFLSFCLHYSNINNVDELKASGAEAMRLAWEKRYAYSPAEEYTPCRGDIIFFDNDTDSASDSVAIIMSANEDSLVVISGDSNNKVETYSIDISDSIMGYGLTGELSFAKDTEFKEEAEEPTTEPQETTQYKGLMMMATGPKATIIPVTDLTDVVNNVTIKTENGDILGDGSTVYIGQKYMISMTFAEINTGDVWYQFQHDDYHYLHYQIPGNIHCDPFEGWHPITAKTESGTIEDVGRYIIDANGMLTVEFFDDDDDICFGAKYSNVEFSIEFNATVGTTQSGTTENVVFNDKIQVNLNVDGGAGMTVKKTHGAYDADNHTMEYTVRVEATHGVVKDLVIDDQIWENHYTLRDTIVVTDLEGNILDPQPTVSNHPSHNSGANEGFRLSDFPDFAAGEGFLITYKTQIYDELLGNETVDMWNGLDTNGKNSKGENIYVWAEDWLRVELEKMEKEGRQTVLEDGKGNQVPVIEWEVVIKKDNHNLQGTVIIDTLGEGLAYYQGQPIKVKHYDEWGNRLADIYISWDDITVNGNTMEFALPDGYQFDIIYYTTYDKLGSGDTQSYNNEVKATINGKEETAGGTADVVGFVPKVSKSARGDDGEYVYFTIEADVPGVIKDWGGFLLTDQAAVWGYKGNNEGFLYVENLPEDLVVTAVTNSGRVITFTPYVPGGPTENTYILVYPAEGNQYHSFNIYFNTSSADSDSSKWILDEDSKLTVSYKLPFDAKTGVEWTGELQGDKTLEDVLLEKNTLSNAVYFNYTDVIQTVGSATYKYSPMITKKSTVNDDGTVDYTVTFYNSIPGTEGPLGYLKSANSIIFTDTFDEKLEYVKGSLSVDCYSPWNEGLWFNTYVFEGDISGNTINVSATDLKYSKTNETLDAEMFSWLKNWMKTYQVYCNNIAGGRHVFTYQLKLKDEYLYSTEENKYELDNTAELKWDGDKSSGPVTDTVEIKTGLLDKQAVQEKNKLMFDIHVNERALDILEGSDTLTIEDTMTENLSVYWDSIKLYYENGAGNWIDFNSADSTYDYSVTYDQTANRLTFILPDELHIRIDYTTLITESGLVSVDNAVKVEGKAEVSDIYDAVFKVEQHSGGASGSVNNIIMLKQDGDTDERLPNVTFLLYGPMGDPDAVVPDGAEESIVTDSGKNLHYIGSYTTGADGTSKIETQYLTIGGPYALVEVAPPDGYMKLKSPVYFYYYETDPNGVIQTVTTLVVVENYTYGFVLPETGGTGTLPLAIIGFAMTAFPILYSTIRRKRERRLT